MDFASICAKPEYAVDNLPKDSYERGFLDGMREAASMAADFARYEYGHAATTMERIECECADDALQSFAAHIESEALGAQVGFIEGMIDE